MSSLHRLETFRAIRTLGMPRSVNAVLSFVLIYCWPRRGLDCTRGLLH